MRTVLKALLIATALSAAPALAKKPTDFREPSEMTEEDFRQASENKKGKLTGYDAGVVEDKPKEIPWLLVGLFALCIIGAAPFAMNMYGRTSKEIKTSTGQLKNGMDESPN